MIDGDHIPNNEREAVRQLYGLLFLLGWYEQQFRHALALFDLCETERTSVPKDITLHGWKTMAARDGALAIYNFGQALAAISPRLHKCQTISARVDHPAVRLARKAFRAALPSYDAVRHAVSHASDFNATIEKRDEHSIMPPWKYSRANVTHEIIGAQPVRMTEQLIERAYCVSYAGGVHYYEVTSQTLNVLSKARERVYAAFEQSVDPEFYQCPFCGSRDLQEVYGRRVYKCAACNDRLVTDEQFMYARIGRLRRARHALLALIAWRASAADAVSDA
jgi:ribosomal protein L37AE/L43A